MAAAHTQERMARKQPLHIAIHLLVHIKNACSAGGCILMVLFVPMLHQLHDPSEHPVRQTNTGALIRHSLFECSVCAERVGATAQLRQHVAFLFVAGCGG